MKSQDTSPRTTIALEAKQLGVGQHQARLCPFCNGGRHHERSLSLQVRNDAVVLFTCHRANCGKFGRLELNTGNFLYNPAPKSNFQPRIFNGETETVGKELMDILWSKYGLGIVDIKRQGWSQETYSGRLVIPIQGPLGGLRGHELRDTLGNSNGPKTLHYKQVDEPWVHWATLNRDKRDITCLVEDVISTAKVSRQFQSVSLMGSHLGLEAILEVASYTDNILLCLDKDASEKALAYKKRFMYVAPKMHVRLLQQDLKYNTDQEIFNIITSL